MSSDIKADLRLIREKCPTAWVLITKRCPKEFYDELEELDRCGNYRYLCKACWDKAIESDKPCSTCRNNIENHCRRELECTELCNSFIARKRG